MRQNTEQMTRNEYAIEEQHKQLDPFPEYNCEICGLIFLRATSFETHYCHVANPVSYECFTCKTRYAFAEDLAFHLQIHKRLVEETFNCYICGLGFERQDDLNLHMSHHKSQFRCPFCNENFDRRRDLRDHIKIHASEKLPCEKFQPLPPKRRKFSTEEYYKEIEPMQTAKKIKSNRIKKQVMRTGKSVKASSMASSKMIKRREKPTKLLNKPVAKTKSTARPMNRVSKTSKIKPKESLKLNKEVKCKICDRKFTRKVHLFVHMKNHQRPTRNSNRIRTNEETAKNQNNFTIDTKRSPETKSTETTRSPLNTPQPEMSKVIEKPSDNKKEEEFITTNSMKAISDGLMTYDELSYCPETPIDDTPHFIRTKSKINCHSPSEELPRKRMKTRSSDSTRVDYNESKKTKTEKLKPRETRHKTNDVWFIANKSSSVNNVEGDTPNDITPQRKRGHLRKGKRGKHLKRKKQQVEPKGSPQLHQCSKCDKKYVHKCDLQRHYRQHNGINPYKCYICGKGFYRADYRNNHMRTHQK